MSNMKMLPIGTKVFYFKLGWGIVSELYPNAVYSMLVKFHKSEEDKDIYVSYTQSGCELVQDKFPVLSLTEYSLESGGFTPISKYWDIPRIGDWGYFWDFTYYNTAIFAQLKDIDSDNKFHSSSAKWDNFSIDIPEHIKKLM